MIINCRYSFLPNGIRVLWWYIEESYNPVVRQCIDMSNVKCLLMSKACLYQMSSYVKCLLMSNALVCQMSSYVKCLLVSSL